MHTPDGYDALNSVFQKIQTRIAVNQPSPIAAGDASVKISDSSSELQLSLNYRYLLSITG